MHDFPPFMKHPDNRIAPAAQATPGVEGYLYDGADGGQMALWNCTENATSSTHSHPYDEYLIVVEGRYTLLLEGTRIPLCAGQEYWIPAGVPHASEVVAGTRTIHAFGGRRAQRLSGVALLPNPLGAG